MRYLVFWMVVVALLTGRVVYYDEIRPHARPEPHTLVQAHSLDRVAAAGVAATSDEAASAAPIRMSTGR